MELAQSMLTLRPFSMGFHIITDLLESHILREHALQNGMVFLTLQHTSASLSLGENADPSVRVDLDHFLKDICDAKAYFKHIYEGDDDMPAHLKSSLLGTQLQLGFKNGRFVLGTWQGIYLGEHRHAGGSRKIAVSVIGL